MHKSINNNKLEHKLSLPFATPKPSNLRTPRVCNSALGRPHTKEEKKGKKEREEEEKKRRKEGRKEGEEEKERKKEEERKCRSGGGGRRNYGSGDKDNRREEENVAAAARVVEFCDIDIANSMCIISKNNTFSMCIIPDTAHDMCVINHLSTRPATSTTTSLILHNLVI
ncbi:hypothetical protein M9H77_21451 [Catharanthus roseus]|uniref:Uncharacterized protein n=1 Tax=Catharanthus roseus TaxID=4058 RepID=A0ACC0AMF4_CATRO|nr:hypothetical protein M9H77_21451 [Catharanthus roseus]